MKVKREAFSKYGIRWSRKLILRLKDHSEYGKRHLQSSSSKSSQSKDFSGRNASR
jgi:hypothetical protein